MSGKERDLPARGDLTETPHPGGDDPPAHGAATPPPLPGDPFEALFELSLDLLAVAGLDGYYKRVNPAFRRVLGYSEGELLGRPFMEFIHPDDHPVAEAAMAALLDGAPVTNLEDRNVCKDGSHRWIAWKVVPDLEQGLVYGVGRDITERKAIEAELERTRGELERRVEERTASLQAAVEQLRRENSQRQQAEAARRLSDHRFRAVAQVMDDVVWSGEVDEGETEMRRVRVSFVNAAATHISGLSQESFLAGFDALMTHIHPEDAPRVEATLRRLWQRRRDEQEYRVVRPGGEERWVRHRIWLAPGEGGAPARVGGVTSDITDQRLAEQRLQEKEAQLQQVQKLEAVGQLAGGMAHEYNNILQVIRGFTHLSRREVEDESVSAQFLDRVMDAVDRAARVTEQLLSFSRRQPMQPRFHDPNTLLADHLRMIRPLLGERVTIEQDFAPNLGAVRVDAAQLQQVLLNLVLNARDAMPDGGTLTLSSAEVLLEEGAPDRPAELSPGPHACVTVRDSGVGMTEEVRGRIFEPFFTTKEVGRGTGLGLATAYGIVRQHGSALTVESEPGRGAAFSIWLPMHGQHGEGRVPNGPCTGPRGHEGVLVAEDEPTVLALAATVLGEAGYRTFTARDGAEALRIFSQHAEEIDLALLDVVMPRVSGRAAGRQMRAMKGSLPLLYCTGYALDSREVALLLAEEQPLLRKPFDPTELLAAVRRTLDDTHLPEAS